MRIVIETPTKAYLSGVSNIEDVPKDVKSILTFTNNSIAFELKKTKQNQWFRSRNPKEWTKKINELREAMHTTLVFKDENGVYIRPGSIPYLKSHGIEFEVENRIHYPSPRPRPWYNNLPFELYWYQKESIRKLLEVKHGAVSLATGCGKTACILTITRELGLKTVIVTPAVSIFSQILKEAEHHFGKSSVGALGDGKKVIGKNITICVGKSLTSLEKNTEWYNFIESADVLIVDESHTWGAETLEEVCHGVAKNIPYRFFFSGTQTRGDGTEKLLQSIIGPIVHTVTTKEAIGGGFICDHQFKIKRITSNSSYKSDDMIEMKRVHFLRNENIADFIAKLAEAVYKTKNEKVLVLVDEVLQISILTKKLTIPYTYAHSCTNKKELSNLGLEKSDINEAIKKFNNGEVAVLIGTSCLSTGVNIFPTHHTVNWQGGTSEIKTKQGAIGRSVRKLELSPYKDKHPPKPKSIIWDFDVVNVPAMEYQLRERIRYYKDSGTAIETIE